MKLLFFIQNFSIVTFDIFQYLEIISNVTSDSLDKHASISSLINDGYPIGAHLL